MTDPKAPWRCVNCGGNLAPADGEAHAEIQRLQDAKRRALSLADERAKENVALRGALGAIARTTFSGSDTDEKYMQGNYDAHAVCASMARAALSYDADPAATPDEGPDPLGYAKGERL